MLEIEMETEETLEFAVPKTEGGEGTSDYRRLTNKPKINNVELTGDKTLDELGIQAKGKYANKVLIEDSTETILEIEPNKYYQFSEVTELNITLKEPIDTTILNEYMFEFISGDTATTLTLPDTIKWLEEPTIEADKTYQCSIVNNIGVLLGV